MAKITLTWITHNDDRTCKVCKALNGFQWVFEAGKDVMTDALFHPTYGIVWSLSQGSNAHASGYLTGHTYNCRCRIDYKIEAEDILAKCVYLQQLAMEMSNDATDTKTGSYRSTTLEDLGITL